MQIPSLSDQPPGVTAIGQTTPMTMTSPPPTAALNGTLSGIAQQLGMSVSGVQSAIREGSSIAGLAQGQGVPTTSIISSVQRQIQSARQASGQPPMDEATLHRLTTRAITHHHHRPGAAPSAVTPSTPSADPSAGSSFSALA